MKPGHDLAQGQDDESRGPEGALKFKRGLGTPQKGPLLGTNPAIDREEAKVDRMITSICRGC